MGVVNNIIKSQDIKKQKHELYLSSDNYLFFGTGKSAICAGLSELTPYPVLALSPAGGSNHLMSEFPNFISYSVSNFEELMTLITDLETTFDRIKKIMFALATKNTIALDLFKEVLLEENEGNAEKAKEEYDMLSKHASENTFPISAICVEECNIISSWKQDDVETNLEIEKLGENKKDLGSDWRVFKSSILELYGKILKLPVTTILCTSEILPEESQKIKVTSPDICIGAGNRLLRDMIGNVFYCNEESGKFIVRFNPSKTVFAKSKFKPVKLVNIDIVDEIDITNNPSLMWVYIRDIKNSKTNEAKALLTPVKKPIKK